MKRIIGGLISIAGLSVAALVPTGAVGTGAEPCGLTTLDAIVKDTDGDGDLECFTDGGQYPGQDIVVREELAAANPARDPRAMLSFAALADFQLADEESPLRGEWADKCGDIPTSAAFRPQETMVPHLLNGHVQAARAIAQAGTPIFHRKLDYVMSLGDLADNQQFNEVRWYIDMLDGDKLINPDSGNDPLLGGEGYDGVQGADPRGAGDLTSPVAGESLLDLANEPFWAHGLRYEEPAGNSGRMKTKQVDWYAVMGNHDMKVQGTVDDSLEAWRQFARLWAVGRIKVQDLAPDYQQEVCESNGAVLADPNFWMKVLQNPGTTKIVPSDPDRRLLDKGQWIAEHFNTTGKPEGHGFKENDNAQRCRDDAGALLARACYWFQKGDFAHVVLDTNPAEGLESGNVDDAQWNWLERTLQANSARYRNDDNTAWVENPGVENHYVIVYSHHTIGSTTNTGLIPGTAQGIHTGPELRDKLLRFPNVIAQADGHTHENKVTSYQNDATGSGYWEINTSAIADWPHQSRVIELADNQDGTLSIFGVLFDARSGPNARDIDWVADDPTDETDLAGAFRDVNEAWLASAGREIGWNDPQADLFAIGEAQDQNVELLLPKPF